MLCLYSIDVYKLTLCYSRKIKRKKPLLKQNNIILKINDNYNI